MRALLDRLHKRMGDFWWYSLMLFCACRVADLLNAFVGLWLVPKYVDPSELGAVMPLTNFATLLAIPVAAFAIAFRNEVSRLSINGEFGKLKTLMRGVFIASTIFLSLAIVIARFTFPHFLERIRIAEGSLGVIIIAASFVSAVAPIYSNALQALKKFKAQSVISIIGAPVRLITMLATMPIRAVTGYFVGQASVPAFHMAASVICLRKELTVAAEPYWERTTVGKFIKLFMAFLTAGIASSLYPLVESTVLRQRLPDLDSAGYYMATRFSDIAGFLAATLAFTLFPFIADTAKRGEDTRSFTVKSILANGFFCFLLAIPFFVFGKAILSILPHGDQYAEYWWAIPWLIAIVWISSVYGFYSLTEIAASRFGFLKWAVPLDILYAVLLLIVTGHGYLTGNIPHTWTDFLNTHNIYTLKTMLCWMTAINVIKAIFSLVAMSKQHHHRTRL